MFAVNRSLILIVLLASAATITGCIRYEEAPAYVRVLDASLDYATLDLYADDESVLEDLAFETLSAWTEVTAGEVTFDFTRAGVTSMLSSRDEDLDADSHTTFVAYGATGSFATVLLDEDRDAPDSGQATVQILNTATDAGDLDVYLTGDSDALGDVSATFSTVAAGDFETDGAVTLDSGTYRLRVVAAGSTTDVRLDTSGVSLASRSVTTLLVTPTSGGVLVNAIVLPQQGAMTMLRNPQSRIRAAIGIEDATSVAVMDGTTALLTGAPYTTLSGYRLVDAGTRTMTVSVAGTTALQAEVTLVAGANYTFLVHGTASTPTYALLEDVERLPADDQARVRLVNAMDGLAAPISLAVDWYPLIEGVALGEASAYTDTASASDARLDVTNTSTAASLYYETAVDLDAGSLYSLVMFGSESAATGVLRKDR